MTFSVVGCDLDGVIWRGDEPIAGSDEAVARLRATGARVGFLTNNSSHTVKELIAKLADAGVKAEPDDVLTSAHAAVAYLAESVPTGSRVLPCAGSGVVEALEAANFTMVDKAPAHAVVVGWHRTFDFDELDRASYAIRDGARFIATNDDATYPAVGRLLPGNGALVAAVATASGASPEITGKPYPPTVALVRHRLGEDGLMIGDRWSTDGALARALGWPFALVLSGVTSPGGQPGGEDIPNPPPEYVADNLSALVDEML